MSRLRWPEDREDRQGHERALAAISDPTITCRSRGQLASRARGPLSREESTFQCPDLSTNERPSIARLWPRAVSCNRHARFQPRQASIGSTRPTSDFRDSRKPPFKSALFDLTRCVSLHLKLRNVENRLAAASDRRTSS